MAYNRTSQSASAAGHGTPTGWGISLEAYQAIRSAVAEEVALRSGGIQFTASESGASAVARERGERGAGGASHGTIVVS